MFKELKDIQWLLNTKQAYTDEKGVIYPVAFDVNLKACSAKLEDVFKWAKEDGSFEKLNALETVPDVEWNETDMFYAVGLNVSACYEDGYRGIIKNNYGLEEFGYELKYELIENSLEECVLLVTEFEGIPLGKNFFEYEPSEEWYWKFAAAHDFWCEVFSNKGVCETFMHEAAYQLEQLVIKSSAEEVRLTELEGGL